LSGLLEVHETQRSFKGVWLVRIRAARVIAEAKVKAQRKVVFAREDRPEWAMEVTVRL
jgi:hypothetical protein